MAFYAKPSYTSLMSILPKARPRSAIADVIRIFRRPVPHKWGIMGACAALTYFLVWAFITEFPTRRPHKAEVLTYVHVWAPHRTQAQITASNRAFAAQAKQEAVLEAQAEAERRAELKRLQDFIHKNGLY